MVLRCAADMPYQDCDIQKLRRLDHSELELGKPLRGHVRNHRGQIVMLAGHVLAEADLATLEAKAPRGQFAGPDWTDDESAAASLPADVLEELRQQRKQLGEKRARHDKRHTWSVRMTVELEEATDISRRRRKIVVTTHDLSTGGFAFTYRRYIHPGTQVRAMFDSLPGTPTMLGIVRHCNHLGGSEHRIGVEFLNAIRHGQG